jgi:hypothetical protein
MVAWMRIPTPNLVLSLTAPASPLAASSVGTVLRPQIACIVCPRIRGCLDLCPRPLHLPAAINMASPGEAASLLTLAPRCIAPLQSCTRPDGCTSP